MTCLDRQSGFKIHFMRLLLWTVLGVFSAAAMASIHANKLRCTAYEIKLMDCHLHSGVFDLRLLPKTIAWFDGTWHNVDDMPLNGDSPTWEKIRFQVMEGRPILQLWLWGKDEGETKIQSLHWFTLEAEKKKFTTLADGIVRKRHPEPSDDPTKPTQYLYDAWEPHSLKARKNGELEWRLSHQQKIFQRKK